MFMEHPVLGLGLGNFMAGYMGYVTDLSGDWSRPQYAHSCYLQLLGEQGLVGLSAFMLLSGWVLTMTIRRLTRSPEPSRTLAVGPVVALIAFLVNIALDTGLYSVSLSLLFWFLMGLAVGQASARVGSQAVFPRSVSPPPLSP
jgi:O-antigen ligase